MRGLFGDWANPGGLTNKAIEQRQLAAWNLEEKRDELKGQLAGHQAKVAAAKQKYGENSPEYKQAMEGLTQANQAYDDLLNPQKNPGVLRRLAQRFGVGGKVETPTPAPRISTSATEPGLPATTTPGLPTPAMTLPAFPPPPGQAGPVKGPLPPAPAASKGKQDIRTLKAQAQAATGAVPSLSTKPQSVTIPAQEGVPMQTAAEPAYKTVEVGRAAYPGEYAPGTAKEIRERAQRRQTAEKEAAGQAAAAPEPTNKFIELRNQLTAAGLTPEQAQRAVEIAAGVEAKAAPEKPVSGKWQPVAGKNGEGKPPAGVEARLIQALYGDHPTAEQWKAGIAEFRELNTPVRTNSSQVLVYDQDNVPHVFERTSTSRAAFPGAAAAGAPSSAAPSAAAPPLAGAGVPKTPGEARKQAKQRAGAAPAAPKSPIGPPLPDFVKASAPLQKARSAYSDAVKIASMADDLVQNHNSEKDALFVLSLIRSEAGRVNQQEIAQLFNAGGLAEGPERWAAKVGHGELPQSLRLQLQDFTRGQVKAAGDAVNALRTPGPAGTPPPQTGGGGVDDDIVKALGGK